MTDEGILSEMREKFGDTTTEGYLSLITAMRSLTFIWDGYIRSPFGSTQERVLQAALREMMGGFEDHPDKATAMIESLLALIQHMRMGGSFESWFEAMGISPKPGEHS